MCAYCRVFKVALGVLAGFISGSAMGQGLIWELVDPEVFADPDYSGAYGGLNGLDGYFYMWTAQSRTPFYGISRSLDGVSWELVGPGSRGTEGIKLSDGRILLYGDTDTIVIGQGDTWDVRDASPSETGSISSAVEAMGRIVMVGNSTVRRLSAPARWVSSDGGATFSLQFFGEANGRSRDLEMAITFAEGRFVAVGVPGLVWTSTDGDEWTSHPLPSLSVDNNPQDVQLSSIVHVDDTFFAGGDFGTLYKSADGIAWELLMQGDTPGPFNTLDKFVVDGDNIYVAGASGDTFWSDDRGVSWNYYFRSGNLSDLTGGNGRYYAGGHIVPGGGPISPERDLNITFWKSFGGREIGYTQGKWLVLQSVSSAFYLGSPETGTAGFLDSAVTTDNIYYQHPWFGWYTLRSGDWVYHFNMGWIYSGSGSNQNVWIYAGGFDWIFTSESLWPFFYHLSSGHWVLYAGGPDWFWNETLQAWMQRNEF